MVEQGLGFAAARLQALARCARVRKLVASIWRQADEFATKVLQDEREAKMREEARLRAKQKVSLCSTDDEHRTIIIRSGWGGSITWECRSKTQKSGCAPYKGIAVLSDYMFGLADAHLLT